MSRFFDDLLHKLSRHLHVRREAEVAPLEARAVTFDVHFPDEGHCLQAVFQIASVQKIASAQTTRLAAANDPPGMPWLLSLTFYIESEACALAIRDCISMVTQALEGAMADDLLPPAEPRRAA